MRVYCYCVLHRYLYKDNKIVVYLQDIKAIIRSSERQHLKIEEVRNPTELRPGVNPGFSRIYRLCL